MLHKLIDTLHKVSYYKDLSKTQSDLPSRKPLAFFVPDICNASQAMQMDSTPVIHPSAYRKHGGNTVYDGLTLQNKRAFGRICRAVTLCTESKTRHLMTLSKLDIHSVTLTQKHKGVSQHD